MIGPRKIIAHGLGRIAAQKDGARVSDERQQVLRVPRIEFQMFGRHRIDQIAGLFKRLYDDDPAARLQRAPRDLGARKL